MIPSPENAAAYPTVSAEMLPYGLAGFLRLNVLK